MRRWRVIGITAVCTFAAGAAVITLVLGLWFGVRARMGFEWYEGEGTRVVWDARPMKITEEGFIEGRPVKLNARWMGFHYAAASGLPGSLGKMWIPYAWVFVGGVGVVIIGQWRLEARRGRGRTRMED